MQMISQYLKVNICSDLKASLPWQEAGADEYRGKMSGVSPGVMGVGVKVGLSLTFGFLFLSLYLFHQILH